MAKRNRRVGAAHGAKSSPPTPSREVVGDRDRRAAAELVADAAAELFKKAFRSSPVGMVISRLEDGRIIEVNQAFAKLSGFERKELIGRTSVELGVLQAGQRKEFLDGLSRRAGLHEREMVLRGKDGCDRWVLASADHIQLEGDACIVWTGFDITERKRAEEALRESEADLARAQRTAHLGNWRWDLAKDAVRWSEELFRIFGVEPKSFVPSNATAQAMLHPADRGLHAELVAKALKGEAVSPFECRLVRANGEERIVLASGFDVERDAEGKPILFFGSVLDITERKRAEEALRCRERELKEAQRLAGLGSWEWDTTLDTVRWSEELRELMLLPDESPTPTYAEQVRFYTPESRRRLDEVVERALREGTPYALDIEMVRTDGKRVWVTARGEAVRGGSGELQGLRGTVIDITERKQAEEALRESEARARLLEETMLQGVVHQDAAGTIIAMNPAAEAILGKTAQEFLGSSSVKEEHDTVREDGTLLPGLEHPAMRCLKSGEPVRGVVMGVWNPRRQERRWISIDAVPMFREGRSRPTEVYTMFADITERKLADEALAASERLYRAIGESIDYGVWVCDPEGRNTYASESFLKLVGMTQRECSEVGWGNVLHPEDAEATIAAWKNCARTGQSWYREHRFRGVDGQWHPILACGVPVRNQRGDITCWAGINLDISELKRTEEELRKAKDELAATNANLEKLVAERTAKLHELVGELEHFSYTITHDLKSPLRAMRGFAELASMACEEGGGKAAKEFLGRIAAAAERMDHLIGDALNYSRAVRQELPLEDVDAGALLRGMLDSYPELQPERARIVVEGRLPVVLANEAGLTQCFSNLLGNAVKFLKAGEKPEIRVWASPRGEWVRIWVEDKGIGISKDMLPRVFDMFSRGSKEYEGTGIGLALVRKVAQRMGGKVGVESEEGKGSRFWIDLKSGEPKPGPGQASASGAAGGGEGTVLYVEDEESDATFMERAFAEKGLAQTLRLVATGRAAIDYLSGSGEFGDREKYPEPALVLLDLNLPQVSGFGVLEWIQNNPDYARLPVVVFSSSTRDDDRVKAQELGAHDFIPKPSSGLKFGEVVDFLLERWLTRGWSDQLKGKQQAGRIGPSI